jgi:acyl-CoA thioesterase
LTTPLSPQQIADEVGRRMFEKDRAAQVNGMQVAAIAPGAASITMTVRAEHLNGFDICHGGLITTLADTAFAYACNAYNELTVASGLSVDFVAPGKLGDVLTAVGTELSRSGRTGVYDVVVSNQHGERVALFRGKSYRLNGRQVVDLSR